MRPGVYVSTPIFNDIVYEVELPAGMTIEPDDEWTSYLVVLTRPDFFDVPFETRATVPANASIGFGVVMIRGVATEADRYVADQRWTHFRESIAWKVSQG